MSVLDDFRYTVTPLYALRASRAGVKRYAIGRKIELLAKFAHPAVGEFTTAQESDKGQVKRGPPGGGGYSHTLPIRVCAAQRGRDFEAPDLVRGIHFRGVF